MVVQHNLRAMNSNRMLGITTGQLSKSAEKLSSGYKVNRAADDAAGLSISEKMRKQIRGLTQASANAEDGISAVQTAEGALTEVHDMLQRMNELANKAANGTNSVSDRQTIQDEISQLTTEIDRVAETTKFNETYLLKGDGTKGTKTLEAHDAGLAGKLSESFNGKTTFTADAIKVGDTVNIGGTEYKIAESKRTDSYNSMNGFAVKKGDKITQNGVTYTVDADDSDASKTAGIKVKDSEGNALTITVSEGATHTTTGTAITTTLVGKNGLNLSNGAVAAYTGWVAGDKIVDKDGVEYTYVDQTKNAFSPDGVYHAASGFYKTEGSKAADTAYAVKEGDVYTTAEGTNSIVSTTANGGKNKGIVSVEDLQKEIKKLADGKTVTIAENSNATGVTYTVGVTKKPDGSKFTADDIAALVKAGNQVKVDTADYYAIDVASNEKTDISIQDAYRMMKDELEKASSIGADVKASVRDLGDGKYEITQGKVEIDNALTFALHVGADADMTNKIGVKIQTMSSAGLGVKDLNVVDENGSSATYAIDAISDAVATVSAQRSLLGAVQNRLEHTINNLDNVVENTTSAESAIRDTDMATEMVKYSNANILSQAGQSMLAQANQGNQGVLSLLG
ncbi:MAG: hypothetical protein NC311_17110 [Muribaculaceae bacterium]|nr:hypothetical protein [Muribaculaceae bacterium]